MSATPKNITPTFAGFKGFISSLNGIVGRGRTGRSTQVTMPDGRIYDINFQIKSVEDVVGVSKGPGAAGVGGV